MTLLALLVGCALRATDSGALSEMVAAERGSFAVAGQTLQLTMYRNDARACGRSGVYSFLVVERDRDATAPLWVFLPGGGVGYYDDAGYHLAEEERYNDADDLASLLDRLRLVVGEEGASDTALGRAIRQGWRVMVPSLCDHDLYAGLGQAYPENPLGETTVDGLLATEEALRFVEAGDDAEAPRATTQVVLHGASAGAVGAHALATRREQQGAAVGAVILDSLLWSSARETLHRSGCTPQQRDEPSFDWGAVERKVGEFVQDAELFPEAVIGESFTPRFNLYALNDPACCGDVALLPEAEGYSSNCAWAYAGFDERADSPNESYRLDGQAHGLSAVEGDWQARLEAWLYAVL